MAQRKVERLPVVNDESLLEGVVEVAEGSSPSSDGSRATVWPPWPSGRHALSRAWSTSTAVWSRRPRGTTPDEGSRAHGAVAASGPWAAGRSSVRGRWAPAAHT
ncbi:hypothetical protein ACWC2H_11065 [Streptomyces sp. 900105755]